LARRHEQVAAIALCPHARARCPDADEARFAEETLLIEWPKGEAAPTKFWLATVDRNMSFRGLVDLAKLAGASSAIIMTSSRKSASGFVRAAAGGGFHHAAS
jgi:hypothetical protein